MERQGVTRRLAAILAADVAGYTRLMELDEETTLEAWWRARREVIDPDIAAHGGRIVKHTGDGFLAEFATVTEAVKCAAGMQQKLAPLAAGMAGDKRLEFRMGINLGDIVVDDEDIYGDGVNLAARIEGLAEAGGICLSADVYNQVHKRLDCPSSKHSGLLSLFLNGGSGSSWFDVKPLVVDGSSGVFERSVF